MGAVADGALDAGGEAIGVIPQALVDRELAHRGLTELHVVGSLHERKALMADLSDAFVALPGGFGTLDELMEQLTWSQLGLHAKPVGLLDVEGFWRPLIALARHSTEEGFVRETDLARDRRRRQRRAAARPARALARISRRGARMVRRAADAKKRADDVGSEDRAQAEQAGPGEQPRAVSIRKWCGADRTEQGRAASARAVQAVSKARRSSSPVRSSQTFGGRLRSRRGGSTRTMSPLALAVTSCVGRLLVDRGEVRAGARTGGEGTPCRRILRPAAGVRRPRNAEAEHVRERLRRGRANLVDGHRPAESRAPAT